MSILPSTAGPDSGKSLYGKIESAPVVIQWGWNDKSVTPEGYQSIIEEANKSIPLLDYLGSKLILEHLSSSSNWSYKATCPFHKHGHERTASFFLNTEQNRFYCQACGVSGGIVEFIAITYKRPTLLVAEHIIQCVNGKFVPENLSVKKANDRKKYQQSMLLLSDMYRRFISANINNEKAIEYINKCFSGFDSVIEQNPEGVEKSIDEIIKQFEAYLSKYQ